MGLLVTWRVSGIMGDMKLPEEHKLIEPLREAASCRDCRKTRCSASPCIRKAAKAGCWDDRPTEALKWIAAIVKVPLILSLGGDLLTWGESHFLISFSFFARRFFFLCRGLASKIISSSSKVGSQFSLPFCKEDRLADSLDLGVNLKTHRTGCGEKHTVLRDQPKDSKPGFPLSVWDKVFSALLFICFSILFICLNSQWASSELEMKSNDNNFSTVWAFGSCFSKHVLTIL